MNRRPAAPSGLLELAVAELALIERLRVRLEPGFTVISGETGAGKSLLIDALGLVLGARADPGLVRAGAATARVEALFDRPGGDEPLVCVREVAAAGRSLARIDDETVTAARLAAVVEPLVAIHGQHQQQRLLQPATQRDLLDAYAGHDPLRDRVAREVAAWRANRDALEALIDDPLELERRIDLAQHAAEEIAAAAIRPGEVAELRASSARAAGAESIRRLVGSLRARLTEEGRGARETLGQASLEAAELARLDPRFAPLGERIAGLVAEADDVAEDLRRAAALDDEAPSPAALEERLGLLYGLLRKYGPDEEAVAAYGQTAAAEAERLRATEAEREARQADDARLEAEARATAGELTAARRQAGERLAQAGQAALEQLGLPQARLEVSISPADLGPSGADTVGFVLAANPGEPPRPLAEVASGGELSRVALAIETVLARADATPTLVFDEIDAGIGARSAAPVGRALRRVAGDHQVIVVTHLAQIAAHAEHHLLIEKRVVDGRTITTLRRLEGPERIEELAVMLGGGTRHDGRPRPTDSALATARELLAAAEGASAGATTDAAAAVGTATEAGVPG